MLCLSLSLFWECICSNKTPDMSCSALSLLAQKTESWHAFFVSSVNFLNLHTSTLCSVSLSLLAVYLFKKNTPEFYVWSFSLLSSNMGYLSLCSGIFKVFSELINICPKVHRQLTMFCFSLHGPKRPQHHLMFGCFSACSKITTCAFLLPKSVEIPAGIKQTLVQMTITSRKCSVALHAAQNPVRVHHVWCLASRSKYRVRLSISWSAQNLLWT